MDVRTTTNSHTVTIDDGEQVYPCRCGETHRGPYGVYDYMHHECLHNIPLLRLVENDPNYLICPSCGKTFHVREEQSRG